MKPALAEALDLEPHPEGGWYRQTWVSPATVSLADGRTRSAATLIYFLLPAGEASAWHRVASDEIWLAHTGVVTLELGGSGAGPAAAEDCERRSVGGRPGEAQAPRARRALAAHRGRRPRTRS